MINGVPIAAIEFNVNGKLDEELLNSIAYPVANSSNAVESVAPPPPAVVDPLPHPLVDNIINQRFNMNKEILSKILFTIEATMNHQPSCMVHLYGPPGTGKTVLCKLIGWVLNYRQKEADLGHWTSAHQGQNDVLEWLNTESNQTPLLIVNEADSANKTTLQRVIKVTFITNKIISKTS